MFPKQTSISLVIDPNNILKCINKVGEQNIFLSVEK